MKEFSFRFLVADEGIKVEFVQANPTEVIFKVYRDDATTAEPNVNVSEKDNTVVEIREEAASEAPKKSTRKRIDKELFDKLWNAGVSGEAMADQLGTTTNSVYSYAYKHGYGKRNTKESKVERFIEMWNGGYDVADIAAEFNICISSVYRWATQLPECVPGSERPSGKKMSSKRISAKQLIPDKLAGKLELFVQMWNECIPIAKIADEFKVSVATVCRWASEIPECISSEEKKQKRAAMKQATTVTTDDNTSTATAESLPQPKVSSSKEDWPKSGEHLRENEIKALCGMWHNGHRDVTELARHFQVSRSTIYYQMRVNGLKK